MINRIDVPVKFKGRRGTRNVVTARFVTNDEKPDRVIVRAKGMPAIKIKVSPKGRFYGMARKANGNMFRTIKEFRWPNKAFAASVKLFWR